LLFSLTSLGGLGGKPWRFGTLFPFGHPGQLALDLEALGALRSPPLHDTLFILSYSPDDQIQINEYLSLCLNKPCPRPLRFVVTTQAHIRALFTLQVAFLNHLVARTVIMVVALCKGIKR
jgi:hypothetical protein